MRKIVKKSTFLQKLKNIVAKTRRRFSWRGRVHDENVSFSDAVKIQKESFLYNKNLRASTYTPPYLELAAQLLVPEDQIFKAAANHLTLIAQNRVKYKQNILTIFQEVIEGRKLSSEKLDYLTQKIQEI